MQVQNIKYTQSTFQNPLPSMVTKLGQNLLMPYESGKNYCIYDEKLVNQIANYKEQALPYLKRNLLYSNNEKQIVETLFVIDKIADKKVKTLDKMYPALSRFNQTNSPSIKVLLAGIYRKTQVPDGFGPLVRMLIQDSQKPIVGNFDTNEEVGGAILAYLENYGNINKVKTL